MPASFISAVSGSIETQVIYLVMPDRFQNGDTTNDALGTPNCFDPTSTQKWHGGDLAGILPGWIANRLRVERGS